MPMTNGMFTNLPDDYNRGYSPVPQNYGLTMAVENLRGDNPNLPQSFNDKLNSIAEASLKAAQLKKAMNQQPQEDLKSNLQKRLDERKARAVGMSELLKNRTNDEFNKRLYDSYIESKLGPVSKKEDFNGLFSPIPQSLPPPETKTRNTTEPQYTPIPDSYKALLEKDKQSEQPAKAKSTETKPSVSAPDRSKDFIERYREAARNATMELDPVSFQSNINVAMRDPVYGNATATGLATGQNLLNSWIAGNNAKARRDKETLGDMRWIKQMEDADEDRRLRRQELAESKKTPVESVDFDPIYFASKEDTDKYNQMISDPIFKAQVADNPVAAFKIAEARKAKQKQIDKFNKETKRSVMDTNALNRLEEEAIKKANGDLFDEFAAQTDFEKKYGRRSSGGLWDRLLNDTNFQIQVAKKLDKQRGNRATRAFDNLASYQNMLSATGHMNEARMLGQLIRDQLKGADPILEVIAGEAEDSPVYIRSKGGAYVFDPLRPTELLPFTVE